MESPSRPRLALVVDDSARYAVLAEMLRQQGFAVLQQAFLPWCRGRRASDYAPAFDLLILQLSSTAAAHWVRDLRREDCRLPLLLLLDRADAADRAALLEAGADDVLGEPIGVREVVARCRALLRRSRHGDSGLRVADHEQVLQLGRIRLDPLECRVSHDGHGVALTPREFHLLRCFMQHPGVTLSREALLQQVWGVDYAGDSKTVDVHVLWIRRKLADAGITTPLLVTVRGIGYRLDPPSP